MQCRDGGIKYLYHLRGGPLNGALKRVQYLVERGQVYYIFSILFCIRKTIELSHSLRLPRGLEFSSAQLKVKTVQLFRGMCIRMRMRTRTRSIVSWRCASVNTDAHTEKLLKQNGRKSSEVDFLSSERTRTVTTTKRIFRYATSTFPSPCASFSLSLSASPSLFHRKCS